jgi:hypothetical protein
MTKNVNELIDSLAAVPGIIADLGLSIAEAQKALNLEYLNALERVFVMAQAINAKKAPKAAGAADESVPEGTAAAMQAVLEAFTPTRYQFTETSLAVRLDLARSLRAGATVGGGAALGAVLVNAALTVGYGYDFRGAAEVRTVLHAAPPGADLNKLTERAAKLGEAGLTLPTIDFSSITKQVEKAAEIYSKVTEGLLLKLKDVATPPAKKLPESP